MVRKTEGTTGKRQDGEVRTSDDPLTAILSYDAMSRDAGETAPSPPADAWPRQGCSYSSMDCKRMRCGLWGATAAWDLEPRRLGGRGGRKGTGGRWSGFGGPTNS